MVGITQEEYIRFAEPADVPVIHGLLQQLMRAEGSEGSATEESIGQSLFAEGRPVLLNAFVVVVEEKVIAAALFYPGYDVLTGTYGLHLSDFVVDEAHRKQGVGKRLFGYLAAQNLDGGGQWMALTVVRTNEAARGFYEYIGMTHVEVDFFAIGPKGLANLIQ